MENRFHKKARSLGFRDPRLLKILDGKVGEDVVDELLDYMAEGNFRYIYACGAEFAPHKETHRFKGGLLT